MNDNVKNKLCDEFTPLNVNTSSANLSTATEQLLTEVFASLMPIGLQGGISIKRMGEILTSAQIKALARQGLNQQQIMAESGFSAKTVRAWLHNKHTPSGDIVTRFIGRWSADPVFPDTVSLLESSFPSWLDLCDKHSGGEMTAASLLDTMVKRGAVDISENTATLVKRDNFSAGEPVVVDAARRAIQYLVGTVTHNLSGQCEKYYERRVISQYIPRESLPKLRQAMAEIAEAARNEARAVIKETEIKSSDETPANNACGLGLYWFQDADL